MDWKELAPVLFLVLYGIFQFIASRRKAAPGEDAAEEQAAPAAADDAAAEERARRIREEIQRRIQERRQEEAGPSPLPPRRPEPAAPAGDWRRAGAPVNPSPEPGMLSLEERLAEQRRRLAATERQRIDAEQQAGRIEAAYRLPQRTLDSSAYLMQERASASLAYELPPTGADPSAGLLRQEVLEILNYPGSVRQGILLAEILGPPVGMPGGPSPYQRF